MLCATASAAAFDRSSTGRMMTFTGRASPSAEEMTHYVRFILGKGTYQGKQLLKPGSLATIQTPHVSMGAPVAATPSART